MISCIIVEDQPPAQRILQKYISDIGELDLKGTFSDVIRASEFMKKEKIDLIFLDIHLPKMSGIDFLKSVPNHPKVILTTAFSDYALESYQYNVIDYLLKPISFNRFMQAIAKLQAIYGADTLQFALKEEPKNKIETIFIKSGYEHIQILVSDIIAIKSDSDYTEVITAQKNHLTKNSLKYWLEKLDNTYFCQIHKSYLVNVQNLVKVSGNLVYLTTITLPLGRAYKKIFIENYLK